MRIAALTLLGFSLCMVGVAPAQGTNWGEKLFVSEQGKQAGDALIHDFGTIPHGGQVHHKFKVKNIFAVKLRLSMRVGCHCATVSPEEVWVEPKGDAEIDVTMDARKFVGPKRVSIYVTVGSANQGAQYASSATLQVLANSRADVVLNPGQINLGAVTKGQASNQMGLDVEYAGTLDWRITEIAAHNYPLEATFQETYRRPGQVGYRINVKMKPDAPAGALKHELYLKTNDPASPLVPVLVEASVQSSVRVVPSIVAFESLKVGQLSEGKKVLVQGGQPFRVVSVEGQGDGLTAELPQSPSALQTILLKFQPTHGGELKRQLYIKTDLAGSPVITVSVEGKVQ